MREIKFRGLHKDDNEGYIWIIGFPIESQGTWIIRDNDGDYPVNPETIGQYTGYRGAEWREIYEGDIIDFAEFLRDGSDIQRRGVVYFDDGSFGVEINEKIIFELSWVMYQDCEAKVIGNIHENPELLKGAEE